MPAYLIVLRKEPIRNADAMNEYQRRTREINSDIKMTPKVVYGAIECLEGAAPDGVVMLEFASVEEARRWYHNEDYQKALPYRLQAAEHEAFIVEGFQI